MLRRDTLRASAFALLVIHVNFGVGLEHVSAQSTYPRNQVTLIVPLAPGTEVDWSARAYAQKLSELWKVPVVVENRLGVGGDVGTGYAAKAPGDGQTILFTGISFAINPLINKASYDPAFSFKPVMLTGVSYFTLVVSAKTGFTTLKEFITAVKSSPGRFNYSSPGNGSVQHLVMEQFKKEVGLHITHIPYKGANNAIADLASGIIDVSIVSSPQVIELERAGRVRMLALLAPDREVSTPHVPTVVELGYPRTVVTGWSAAMLPVSTPDEIVQKLNRDMNMVRERSDMQEAFLKRSGRPDIAGGSTERLAKLISADLVRWKLVVAEAHIRPD